MNSDSIRFRDAQQPSKLAIDGRVVEDRITLLRAEPDGDSLSGPT